jgi:predicted outer membrane repeat protein
VTNLGDVGAGSLRQALIDTPPGGTVDFQAGLAGTITLTAGTLAITKDLTITGPGADIITVSGNNTSGVFEVHASATVAIAGLTVTAGMNSDGGGVDNRGTLTLTNDAVTGNVGGWGGGIRNDGTLTITDSVISGNTAFAQSGGGIANFGMLTIDHSTVSDNSTEYAYGGGIDNAGTLTVSNSSISHNHADFSASSGGGIASFGALTITNSTLSDNSSGRDGGAIDSLFNLTITGSTLSGNSAREHGGGIAASGPLTVTASTFSNNSAGAAFLPLDGGGGIYYYSGAASITDSTFTSNSAGSTGGGGIFNGYSSTATMTITGSTFSGNSASGGGGIENAYGTMMLANSTVRDNTSLNGGGIFNGGSSTGGATLTVTNSTISDNTAAGGFISVGGGITNGGMLTVLNSTVSGNSAVNGDPTRSEGGGIDNTGVLTVTNSTLSGNSTFGVGGGIANGGTVEVGGRVTLTGGTISGNSAGIGGGISNVGAPAVTDLRNTIVAGNTVSSSSPDVVGALISQGHNLIGDGTGASGFVTSDLVGTTQNRIDPKLGPLANNGGPTPTMALLPGSPALNAGDPTQLGVADQRGVPRSGGVNIGAFQASASAFVLSAPAKVTAGVPFDLTVMAVDPFGQMAVGYRGTVTFATTDPDPGVVLPAEYAFTADDAGVHTFTDTGLGETTLLTRGQQSITATDTADGSIVGSAAVKVKRAHQGSPWRTGINRRALAGQEKDGSVAVRQFSPLDQTDPALLDEVFVSLNDAHE